MEKCKKHKVNLIVIPYTVKIDDICEYISNEATKLGIIPIHTPKDFDLGELRTVNSLSESIMAIIKAKEGTLIDGIFLNNASKLTIECKKGHVWTTTVKSIKYYDAWCHTCAREKSEETKEKTSIGVKKFNQTEEGKEIKNESHKKRSATMDEQKRKEYSEMTDKFCNECGEERPVAEFKIRTPGKAYETYCLKHQAERRSAKKKDKRSEAKKLGITYDCTICARSYQEKNELNRHVREKHPKN